MARRGIELFIDFHSDEPNLSTHNLQVVFGPPSVMTHASNTPVGILDANLAALRQVRALSDRYGEYGGLIEMARRAVGFSRPTMTSLLGVTQQAFHRLCTRSTTNPDSLKVATLRRVASALGCEAVIVFVPKAEDSFGALAKRARPARGYFAGWD